MENIQFCDWLIVIFIHEIFEDIPIENDHLLNVIQEVGSGKDNLIYLIKDSVTLIDAVPTFGFKLQVFKLTESKKSGKFDFVPVPEVTIINSDRHCWQQGFEYIYGHVSAKRRVLITFSHGAAFGINTDLEGVVRRDKNLRFLTMGTAHYGKNEVRIVTNENYYLDKQEKDDLADEKYNFHDENFFRQTSGFLRKGIPNPLCKNLEILWISELSNTLTKCLDGNQIDIMLMVNCFMQLFDTGFILKQNVKLLVGPEGSMFAFGYDYRKLLLLLDGNPCIPNDEIILSIIENYKIKNIEEGREEYLSKTTLFANVLEHTEQALKLFNEFVGILEENLSSICLDLNDIRNNHIGSVSIIDDNENNNHLDLVDLRLWVKLVIERLPNLFADSKIEKEFEEIHQMMIPRVFGFIGETLVKHDQQFIPKFGYSGISIYFPKNDLLRGDNAVPWCAYFDNSVFSSFKDISYWDEFLKKYYQVLKTKL